MMWFAIAAAVTLVVIGLVVMMRSRGRNSGSARARDVDPVNPAHPGAYGAATQHQGNIYGSGGGLPL